MAFAAADPTYADTRRTAADRLAGDTDDTQLACGRRPGPIAAADARHRTTVATRTKVVRGPVALPAEDSSARTPKLMMSCELARLVNSAAEITSAARLMV